MKILGGDFKPGPVGITKNYISGSLNRLNWGWFTSYKAKDISSVEIVTQDSETSLLRAGAGVAIGAILLGPIGAIVGGLLSGKKNVTILQVTFADGKSALMQANTKEMTLMLGAAA